MPKPPADGPNQINEPSQTSRAVKLTRAGMWWEEFARAFWPFGVALALVLTALAFGIVDTVGNQSLRWGMGVAALLLVAMLGWGGWRFRTVSVSHARGRVDATLPGRPLAALRDHAALGAGDPGAAALWRAHMAQMQAAAAKARAVRPDAGLRTRDPYGLRLVALVAVAMTLIFAPSGRIGQGFAALGSTFRPVPDPRPDVAAGPSWEGWAQPPAYTRRPTIYLNALPDGQVLELPQGAKLSFRLYGEGNVISQDVGAAVSGADAAAPEFAAEQSGTVQVAGRQFPITVIPDAAPVVQAGDAPERRADGRLVQDFTASDDNGVVDGQAEITLDIGAVDRRFGLAVDPDPREPIMLDLPMPSSSQAEVRGRLTADLSRHPWANLPVTVRLHVTDGIDQRGDSAPLAMVLPGRRFFDPVAAALIELRRDLLWSQSNAGRDAMVLRAVTWQPDGFMDPDLAHGLEGTIQRLESGPMSEAERNDLAQLLWDAAIALEDGGLSDALAQMQQAQERLSEAIRQGASPDEVQRLMDELQQATDNYLDMLAQQQPDPSERFDRSPQQDRQQISGDQIQQMMDEIQRLMNEGRMAEAQELLEQFNRMMQNMRVTEAEGEGSGRSRPSDRLAESLRQQQELADEAMRDLQEQFGRQPQQPGQNDQQGQDQQGAGQQGQNQQGQNQPGAGQQGEQGQGQSEQGQQGSSQQGSGSQGQGQSGGSLADRQRELREDLGRQRGLLPGEGSEQGDRARRSLDDAGRAMEEAERLLRGGDPSGAMQRQADAIQAMRDGMRALGQMNAENDQRQDQGANDQSGQGPEGPDGRAGDPQGQRGLASPNRQTQTDPLGRSLSGEGNSITGGGDPLAEGVDPSRRARDLQDEIRRRSGERDRPSDERDYLDRLLDGF